MFALLACLPAFAQQVGIEELRQTQNAFANVAREVSPSVVSVQTRQAGQAAQMQESPLGELWPFDDDLLKRFFGDRLPELRRDEEGAQVPRSVLGQGSGFVFRVAGALVAGKSYIMTNRHVVEDAESIEVRLQDGRSFDARIKGIDPQSDVAVLEIDTDEVRPLRLGDSAELQVGDWALAIGNPFGLQHTLTVGVVSAKGRTSLGISDYEDFIQTDAAINPGNSGGPLVNLDGEVVGMNTAIFSRSGGYMGIGFAIPINLAKRVATQLIERGEVVRGHLGVVIQNLTQELAQGFGLEQTRGVLIAQVNDGSPAERGGLRQGDIVVSYQGEPVKDIGGFRNRVAQTEPGSRAQLGILRDGQERELTVEIGRLSPAKLAALDAPASARPLGLTVQTLTAELAEQFGTTAGSGVIVTEVQAGSIAARAGIDSGTIILQVDREPVKSARQFSEAVDRSQDDKRVLLLVRKGDMQQYLVLQWR
jgi:serine protease Do